MEAPYGSWKSPLTSDVIASTSLRLGEIRVDGEDIYWVEGRPAEGGREVVVRLPPGAEPVDVTPPEFYVRSLVHEYGGGAYVVYRGTVYFSNLEDQSIYRMEIGAQPTAITPAGSWRFADACVDPIRREIICVREDHSLGEEPANTIVAVPMDGQGPVRVLVSGADFYSNPRLSDDGSHLLWLSWNHPDMPWDGTQLWCSSYESGELGTSRLLAGGRTESVFQPEWDGRGILYVSDSRGWWNLYRYDDEGSSALWQAEAEFGVPQWVFGLRTYTLLPGRRLACIFNQMGRDRLGILDLDTLERHTLELPYSEMTSIAAWADSVVMVAASESASPAVVRVNSRTGAVEVLKRSSSFHLDSKLLSLPEQIEFPTDNDKTAFAFYYAPCNPGFHPPRGDRPPLLVMSHGGPTAASPPSFAAGVQFWTTRGIGVLDVNYGGSTGYGREYRERLRGNWGVVDWNDCVNGARFLVERGHADVNRLAIRGGSAGGYTTLCALTFSRLFSAGASHYGVSDLTALAKDTHKFESRYLDGLVGDYPDREDLYHDRSPLHFADQVSSSVIFFQGAEDRVVPPNQTEMMVNALKSRGVPVAYLLFEGEQHGFRRAENMKRALDAEIYFYSAVFGFRISDHIEPVDIANLAGAAGNRRDGRPPGVSARQAQAE